MKSLVFEKNRNTLGVRGRGVGPRVGRADRPADRDGRAAGPAASVYDPELDSVINRWPDVGRMSAGRRTPRGATLAPLEDSSAPSNEQEEGHSTTGSGPNYTSNTNAAWRGRWRRAASRSPGVGVIASRGKSRGARPRAADQQLVGIGQGGCALCRVERGTRGREEFRAVGPGRRAV